MPIGPYPDFAACVAAQKRRGKSDEAAHKICGYIEHKVKQAHMSEQDFEDALTTFEQVYETDEGLVVDAVIKHLDSK
jgi:hypothetical protein